MEVVDIALKDVSSLDISSLSERGKCVSKLIYAEFPQSLLSDESFLFFLVSLYARLGFLVSIVLTCSSN
jgi:hypothetical protein